MSILLKSSNRFVYQKVMGNSMEPNYKEGDMIIADTFNTAYHGGGIFMVDINKGCGTNIARLHNAANGITVIKDNYPGHNDILPMEKADNFVIGKVVGHISKEVLGE